MDTILLRKKNYKRGKHKRTYKYKKKGKNPKQNCKTKVVQKHKKKSFLGQKQLATL